MKLTVLILGMVVPILGTSCAMPEKRLLTPEQDQKMFELCKAGCAILPIDQWEELKAFIQKHSGEHI